MKYTILATALLLCACGGDSTPEPATNGDVSVTGASGESPTTTDVNAPATENTETTDGGDNQNSNLSDSDSSANPVNTPPPGTDTFEHLDSDPLWMACEPDAGLGDRDAWQQIEVQSNTFRDCVKVCPTDDSFIPDPDFPGLGWNNRLRTACAVASAATAGAFIPVPLYLTDTGRQTFTSVWSHPLFGGTGQWQCTHQQRQLSSDDFGDTGTTISYQFYSDGLADVNNAAGTTRTGASWWFDGFAGTRRIVVPTASGDDSLIPSQYIGNVQLDQRTLTVYRTTVDRLHCTAVAPADEILSALSPDALEAIEPLSLQQLTDRSLQCQSFESLQLSVDGQSFSNLGYRSNLDPNENVLIDVREVAETDADGDTRYALHSDDDTTTYTVNSGQFDSTFRIPGNVSRSFSQHLIDFKPYDGRIIMTDTYRQGGSGSSSEAVTYAICE